MSSKSLPEILDRETVAKSRLFTIEALDLRFSNGEQRTYERMKPSGRHAVMMVPITAQGDLLLVRRIRCRNGALRIRLSKRLGRSW